MASPNRILFESIIFILVFALSNFVSNLWLTSSFGSMGAALPMAAGLIAFVAYFALLLDIYHDARGRGLNENYWVLAFLLGGFGGIIYWLIARGKAEAPATPAKPPQ